LKRARQLRGALRSDLQVLVKRGLLAEQVLSSPYPVNGNVNLARELQRLAQVFTEHAEVYRGRCAVSDAELELARHLAYQLSTVTARSDVAAEREWMDLRVRAYSLVCRAHAEARAGVTFLLRDKDAIDRVIPPFRVVVKGAPRRKRSTASSSSPPASSGITQ
jgi:hypothetical protein